MDSTVVVAAMGFAATLTAAWFTARTQRQASIEARLLEAKVRTFGSCAEALYEYERATYNRVKARLASRPDAEREDLRQEAYRCNAVARSVIGQAAILTESDDLLKLLNAARKSVGKLNGVSSASDLQEQHHEVFHLLNQALETARRELHS